MAFEQYLDSRPVAIFADFFTQHLVSDDRVLDCGSGEGAITVGLAQCVPRGSVVGIDLDTGDVSPAAAYLNQQAINHVHFSGASMLELPFADETFSACLCHSSLETLPDPLQALHEIRRVLKPNGLIGAASVEYEGVLIAGQQEALLKQFYAVREALWRLTGVAEPRLGKHLRGLLHAAGFGRISAHAHYMSHGNDADVSDFGLERAADCEDPWYAENALAHDLLSRDDLRAMQAAWTNWAAAKDSFLGFTWCRAIGRKEA